MEKTMSQHNKGVLFDRVIVAQNELALMFRNEQFESVLSPGKYQFSNFSNELTWTFFDIKSLYFSDADAGQLLRENESLNGYIQHWKLESDEAGLLYLDNQLRGVVAPGDKLFLWKAAGDLRLERVKLDSELKVQKSVLDEMKNRGLNAATKLIASPNVVRRMPVLEAQVPANHVGLLFVDGALQESLKPGVYGFWQLYQKAEVKIFDLRKQTLEVTGQEILTKDRVSIRVNLTASVKVENAVTAAEQVDNLNDFIYKTMQLALREAVGTKTLDELLVDKLYVNETVSGLVMDELQEVGVLLNRVGVKDIILPGDIKSILNQVVEAQKSAEANVIKRREETAATRSLHNTAKMMEGNPTLLRLKELEALEKVSERVGNLNVYGGLDHLMTQTVKLS
jgi:regulator of protease activity HflC (stomatin/prohibitin superfamily)